ncbi:YqjD family protein [Rhizobium sp. YIM 134829]|uniref:DUF883 family protein n=1 Tax=Rhizobium sp. YIM 134829 TaxID=3390453 RepID=UPI00397979CF
MSLGLFNGSSRSHRSHGLFGGSVESQLSDIRDEIAELAALLAKRGNKASGLVRHRAHDLRGQAESSLGDLMGTAEHVVADLRHRYGDTGREVSRTVRRHPVATLGAVAAVGLIAAALLRR